MSPIFVMLMGALAAVVVWAILDRHAFNRMIDKRLAEERAYKEELNAFRASEAKSSADRLKNNLTTLLDAMREEFPHEVKRVVVGGKTGKVTVSGQAKKARQIAGRRARSS